VKREKVRELVKSASRGVKGATADMGHAVCAWHGPCTDIANGNPSRENIAVHIKNLRVRPIRPVPYSGVVESLSKIALICHAAGEVKDDLTKDDLMNFLAQIAEIGAEALARSGATREEIAYVTQHLRQGMVLGRERTN